MSTNKKISVSAWNKSQNSIVSQHRVPQRFWPPGLIGLAGTLLLHGFVLQTVVLASLVHEIRPPEIQQPGSSLNKPAAKPSETLVFIDIPKSPHADNEIDQALASLRAAVKDLPIALTQLDPPPPLDVETLALSEDKDSTSSVDSGDGAERARLFGIYSGQIQARVERIWRRPRTLVQDKSDAAANEVDYFQCQVQIVQDSSGNVQEVLLPNCNGSVAWRRSLILAIQQASPLPAPPSSKVFSHSITLKFMGYAYSAGSSEEEYETAPVRTFPVRTVQTISTLPATRPTDLNSSLAPDPLASPSDPDQTNN